jgi:hypothetical protein
VREQGVALEHRPDRPRLGRLGGEVGAVEDDAAAVGQVETGDHAQQGRLAAAGRTEQGEELPRLDCEGNAVDGHEVAESARNVIYFQQRHAAKSLCFCEGAADCTACPQAVWTPCFGTRRDAIGRNR